MKREDYPSMTAYCRALKDHHKSLTKLECIVSRYQDGERDEIKLVAPPMPRSQIAKKARKASAWNKLSPAICYK